MKKWLKKYAGYFGGAILSLVGGIAFNSMLNFSDLIVRFIVTVIGIVAVGMGGTFIGLQCLKNKKEYIIKEQNLKFEDNTKPYEKAEEISNVVHYTKNYIYTETKEDEKDLEL